MAEADPIRVTPRSRTVPRLTAVIVGAGMSGLLAAIRLKREGIESFVILERSGDVGGTWLHNEYPGASCDVPSHPVFLLLPPQSALVAHVCHAARDT